MNFIKSVFCLSLILMNFFCLLPLMAGDIEIVDEGSAGTPGTPTDHHYVHTSTEVAYSSASESLSTRYSPDQMDQISSMMSSDLGISLSDLTGTATGSNDQMVQWTEPHPEPTGPTTNWERVELTTPDGMTVRIVTQITGPDGTYGSTDNNGGTGSAWIIVTDADGNNSFLHLGMRGGEIVFQEFHGEDLIRDNADVSIDGPTAMNEDTPGQWKVVVPDSNLPEETPEVFEIEWTGPPQGTWRAPSGNPASGSGESFSATYIQPGSQMILVEATREYQFKTYRAEPNPDYIEGTSPLEDAFIAVLKVMKATVRGSASLNVSVADITPPDINFIITASHEGNSINVKESPLDKVPPKTQSLDLSGRNFQLQVGTPFSLSKAGLPAGEPIFVGPTLDPSLTGIVVRQHERFKLFAKVKDNATAIDQIVCKWSIENITEGKYILPEGQVEYAVLRSDNLESFDNIVIHVSAEDNAGNITVLEIPIMVPGRDSNVESLALDTVRKK